MDYRTISEQNNLFIGTVQGGERFSLIMITMAQNPYIYQDPRVRLHQGHLLVGHQGQPQGITSLALDDLTEVVEQYFCST